MYYVVVLGCSPGERLGKPTLRGVTEQHPVTATRETAPALDLGGNMKRILATLTLTALLALTTAAGADAASGPDRLRSAVDRTEIWV